MDILPELPPSPLILYGAGASGESCFQYLAKMRQAGRVLFFADSDKSRHGQEKCSLAIRPPEDIGDFPDAAVVIAADLYGEVFASLAQLGLSNSIYCWVNLNPQFPSKREFKADYGYISSFYEDDDITRSLLQEVIACRTEDGYCPIKKYGSLAWAKSSSHDYWHDQRTTLAAYPEITIVDAGSCDGGNIGYWLKTYGDRVKRVYAVEPDSSNCEKLARAVENCGWGQTVTVCRFGLSEQTCTLNFSLGRGVMSKIAADGNSRIAVKKIDDMDIEVSGKLCIKMDIEGSEMKALRGGAGVIEKYRPDLAICVYHKPGDIHDIPEFIKSLVPSYKCVLRGGTHTVCYASVRL
jgi:FkbM family methyltransferase